MKPRNLLPLASTLLGLGAVGTAAFLLSTRRFVVDGHSMEPAFQRGDRLLINKLAYLRSRPQEGDVVVVRRPGEGGRLDLKRVAAGPGEEVWNWGERRVLGDDDWWLLGDNPDESTDSRQLGPARTGEIVGKVLRKY